MTSRRFPPPWRIKQIPGGFALPPSNPVAQIDAASNGVGMLPAICYDAREMRDTSSQNLLHENMSQYDP
jgi:hypothetical protein